jgi:tyrosyl-tRNA synthetase
MIVRSRVVDDNDDSITAVVTVEPGVLVAECMLKAGMAQSMSEARRLITAGAVWVEGERVSDTHAELGAGEYVMRVGKRRWVRLVIK